MRRFTCSRSDLESEQRRDNDTLHGGIKGKVALLDAEAIGLPLRSLSKYAQINMILIGQPNSRAQHVRCRKSKACTACLAI